MKPYPHIKGPSKAPQQPCIAFYKHDGSNLRFEWLKKSGWYKFGTRKRLFDESDEIFGTAIPLFFSTLAEPIDKIIRDTKDFRSRDQFTVYCEYLGPHSFAGQHRQGDDMQLVIIDVNVHKRGIVLPNDFIKLFGHLNIAEVVYEGNFSRQFVENVYNGMYELKEGVVAKGIKPGKKNPQHRLWMAKAKTQWWFEELKRKAAENESLRQLLEENEREQGWT
tara:strand:+ start:2461 stop:3123 length:663 start_codon:yes stop_codon:yes gene_type:complete